MKENKLVPYLPSIVRYKDAKTVADAILNSDSSNAQLRILVKMLSIKNEKAQKSFLEMYQSRMKLESFEKLASILDENGCKYDVVPYRGTGNDGASPMSAGMGREHVPAEETESSDKEKSNQKKEQEEMIADYIEASKKEECKKRWKEEQKRTKVVGPRGPLPPHFPQTHER